ncbi:MAG: AAA family ATPase [Ktedonobacterales bacterium]
MRHLREIHIGRPSADQVGAFPFTVPAIVSLGDEVLRLPTEVTLFVGENGSGKSTLLEALACAIGSITVGSEEAQEDASLGHVRPLADRLHLIWNIKTRRGFFMRTEDFFGYARRMSQLRAEMEAETQRIQADPTLTRVQRSQALMPYGRELGEMRRRYGAGLDAASHGESFLALFQSRFVPNGLYLLDEPEAPLSPMRQLSLVALIQQCVVEHGAQFIIATHSPLLMAIPQATIYNFQDGQVAPITYDESEHVRFLRDFLNAPQRYLRPLLTDEETP